MEKCHIKRPSPREGMGVGSGWVLQRIDVVVELEGGVALVLKHLLLG